MGELIVNGPLSSEPVLDLRVANEQKRMENMQRRLLAAQLASQVLDGAEYLSVVDIWSDLAKVIDDFLKAAE